MVQGLRIKDGHVAFAIEVDPARGRALEPVRKQAETLVGKLPGVVTASVVLTAERKPAAVGTAAAPGARGQRRPRPCP